MTRDLLASILADRAGIAAIRKSSFISNTFINLAGTMLPLCVSILVIPAYLSRIGQSRYGIIALVWLLFGYFGLFDLGLSQATTNHLARVGNQSAARQSEIFWTATGINLILGICGAIVFTLLGHYFLGGFVHLPAELVVEVKAALPWVACLLPLSTTGGVFVGTLEAHERFFQLNCIQALGSMFGQVVPLAAVVAFGPRIEVAIKATVLARFLTTVPIFVLAMRNSGVGAPPTFRRETAEALFRYGGWVTVTNIVGPVLVSIDQFMIGALVGVAAIPKYSIPFGMAMRILLVPAAITRALFPQLTKLGGDTARQRSEAVAVTVSLALVLICAPLMVASRRALTIWLGADFSAAAGMLSSIIIFGVWINGVAFVPSTMLQSQGRPSATAKLHVFELLPFIATLWLGLHFLGLIGAALAWSLRVLLDAVFLFKVAQFSAAAIRRLVPSVIFMVMALGLSVMNRGAGDSNRSIAVAAALFALTLTYAVRSDPTFSRFYERFRRVRIL